MGSGMLCGLFWERRHATNERRRGGVTYEELNWGVWNGGPFFACVSGPSLALRKVSKSAHLIFFVFTRPLISRGKAEVGSSFAQVGQSPASSEGPYSPRCRLVSTCTQTRQPVLCSTNSANPGSGSLVSQPGSSSANRRSTTATACSIYTSPAVWSGCSPRLVLIVCVSMSLWSRGAAGWTLDGLGHLYSIFFFFFAHPPS